MKARLMLLCVLTIICSCKKENTGENQSSTDRNHSDVIKKHPVSINTPDGMVWISGGNFTQGASVNDKMALEHEKPAHITMVTNHLLCL